MLGSVSTLCSIVVHMSYLLLSKTKRQNKHSTRILTYILRVKLYYLTFVLISQRTSKTFCKKHWKNVDLSPQNLLIWARCPNLHILLSKIHIFQYFFLKISEVLTEINTNNILFAKIAKAKKNFRPSKILTKIFLGSQGAKLFFSFFVRIGLKRV